ncbi:hypothetical protein [Longimicrobium sp.]|uniref:CIS tube protein n=1 Tax=Longimicrobium sp. TaxID=2029185 RepID=UPI002E2F0735|nr:hypothetical protein [Longimicrobium sp.]HEX6036946.1 hypothetical protein [Longimicrobium sp.]
MSQDTEFLRACFRILTGTRTGETIDVHFNPVSLQYAVQNTMQQSGGGAQQYVTQSTGKLTMDLVFDTSMQGTDVRNTTIRVARLMQPENRIPPVVRFEWGAYKFEGTVESYKETIDFFSPNGVPLRASLNLTLAAKTEQVFAGGSDKTSGVSGNLTATAVEVPSPDLRRDPSQERGAGGSQRGSPQQAATRAGNPSAARAVAAMNGAESMRFGTGGSLNLAAGVKLGGPAAFASGGAGLSLGASAGVGIGGSAGAGIGGSAGIGIGGSAGIGIGGSAGIGIGGSAGIGIGGSAGIGIGGSAGIGIGGSAGVGIGGSASISVKAGASASAGVSASQGAFAGLSVKAKTVSTGGMEVTRLVAGAPAAQVATEAGASFAVGGRALVQGNASLRADVGAGVSLKGKLTWDGG